MLSIGYKPYHREVKLAGGEELIAAARKEQPIKKIYNSEAQYISPHLNHFLSDSSALEIDENDVQVLKYLSKGMGQEEIAKILQELKRPSASLSSVEKRINKLKIVFRAKNLAHLVSITKDMGLI